MAKRTPSDDIVEIEDQPDDGVVAAEAVLSPEPTYITVRANVHTLGLDPGDVVEIEDTHVIRGHMALGHFSEVREKA